MSPRRILVYLVLEFLPRRFQRRNKALHLNHIYILIVAIPMNQQRRL